MLNNEAKKLLARAARADIRSYRERSALGADVDTLASEGWQQARVHHPEFREWPSAEQYFMAVFHDEIQR